MYLIKMDYEIVSDSAIAFNRPKVKNEEVSISRICENENEIDSVIESEHNAFLNKVQKLRKNSRAECTNLEVVDLDNVSFEYAFKHLNGKAFGMYLKESGII